jgi:hypothetical protein
MPLTSLRALAVAATCTLALAGTAGSAAGQAGSDDAGSPAQQAPDGSLRAADESTHERKTVLFLLPALDDQTRADLREALLAQFALIAADVEWANADREAGALGERMADAQQRAAEHGAIAAFWIDEQPDGRWFVHMFDIERERIVVRPIEAAGDRRASAIEAVAVMARESTRALIAGEPLPELAPEPAPAPTPAPAPPAQPLPAGPGHPTQGPVRLWAAYVGTDFAEEIPWRHGAAAGVGWFGFAPLYAGVSYVFTPALVVDSSVQFDVQRMPIGAQVGYRQQWQRALLDVELGLIVEILRRSELRGATASVESHSPEVAAFSALAPRLRGELTPVPELGLFAAVGLDILLSNFSYVAREIGSEGTQSRTLLRADDVRPALELGVAFYP